MAIEHKTYTKRNGELRTYTYHRVLEIERARAWLNRAPLTAVPTGKGHSVRWLGKTAKHKVTFSDQVIRRLITEGHAVCLGLHVEKRGIVR